MAKDHSPWLRIELGAWHYITKVDIHNRGDGPAAYVLNRILNTEIYVYGENPNQGRELCGVTGGDPMFISTECSKALPGKGVELFQPDQGNNQRAISICKVLIYGSEK